MGGGRGGRTNTAVNWLLMKPHWELGVTNSVGVVKEGFPEELVLNWGQSKGVCTKPRGQEAMLVGDLGNAVPGRAARVSLPEPLSIRGLGCQHGGLHPTQPARRCCYS